MSTAAPTQAQINQAHGNKPQGTGYQFAKPQGICHITQQPIEPGVKFMAALRETPAGFERVDVSLPAWPQFDQKDVIGFWQTVMPKGELKRKIFVDDQVLCEIFERLSETTEPAKLNFRFVLGLILMRKRMIIYEETRVVEGQEIWTVRFKGREDRLDLINPKLGEEQVMEVSQQLSEILNEEV